MGICRLCLELFKELCYSYGHEKPALCQLYEDYATGQAADEGELPLRRAMAIAGWDAFTKARARLVERGILKE